MAQLHVQLESGPVKVDLSCRRARAARQAEQDVAVWRHSARAAAIRGAGHSLVMVEVLLGTQDMHREVISASHLLAFKQQA